MNFLLDENFPKAVRPILEQLGHTVLDFREIGTIGAADKEVIRLALKSEAAILSTDRDFFHTLGRQYSGHCGIVVVALRKPSRIAILDRVHWFLKNIDLENLNGRTFQLRDNTWMVYPPI